MDEMKLKLSSDFMKNFISKLISKSIYKKYGYKVNIQLNDLDVRIIDGETKVATNLELSLGKDEFVKLLNDVGSQD